MGVCRDLPVPNLDSCWNDRALFILRFDSIAEG